MLALALGAGDFGPARAGVLQERALAMWIRLRGSEAAVYIVVAAHRVRPGRPLTLAGVGKIPCSVRRGRNFTNVVCNGRVRVSEVPPDAFVVHPTLETARLTIKAQGRVHRARWRAVDEEPDANVAALPGPDGVTIYAEMTRRVRASGKILGSRLRPMRRIDVAELGRGGMTKIPPRAGRHRIHVEFRL